VADKITVNYMAVVPSKSYHYAAVIPRYYVTPHINNNYCIKDLVLRSTAFSYRTPVIDTRQCM